MDVKVSELTFLEFKTLVREIVEETLADMLADPDEGLELTDEMKRALRQSMKLVKEGAVLYDVDEVVHRLGLED